MKRWLTILTLCVLVFSGTLVLDSCRSDKGRELTILPFTVPSGFPQPVYDFQQNPVTEEGFLLGRKLFYDGRLSKDNKHSCASCHQPEAAFTTFEHDRSHGYNNSHTLRNAPGLFNLAWYPYFNQDGGEDDLITLFSKHIAHPEEMAESMREITEKITKDVEYRKLFQAAYGSTHITNQKILHALRQFVISLVSVDSKYDKVMRGEATFTPDEQQGYIIFQNNCETCHKEPLFTDFSFRNAGFELDPFLNDVGRMRITKLSSDSLKFRVPSLRNAELTSYYIHDGRINMVRSVVQHYRSGIKQSPTLDSLLTNGIPLTDTEVDQLVAFIRTLSDSAFLNNPRFRE